MLPVTLIGGYLGSGKTTLVNQLLRHAEGVKIAVLVNEFGALPIDADLIETQDEALISIAGGCVCCSYGNDLIQAMLDLAKLDPAPDHVILESSGIALPGAIAATVSVLDGFQVDGVVVLTDAETIMDQARNAYIGDTIERQLADASLVVLNKADLVDQPRLDKIAEWLGTQAPHAAVITARQAQVPGAVVMQRFERTMGKPTQPVVHRDDVFESRVLSYDGVYDAEQVAQALAVAELKLVRAKGFVPTADGLRAVQVVGRRWAVSDAPQGVTPGVVAIAERAHVDWEKVEETSTLHVISA